MKIQFSSTAGTFGREKTDALILAPNPEPVITIDIDELERAPGTMKSAVRIDVVGPTGEVGRFWMSVGVRRGRPFVWVHTKPDKHRRKQVSKKVQGMFNIL